MQLKKLILKGFKSFADKTTLDFNDGVTAVVGPNGSGKSNIIEAIQWVMGEQSAKSLRGGKMNDVIFSGTNDRKSMNIAEVTIILDNTTGFLPVDYEEVSVTRRLSRSGESDYFINKQACRLKDIVELFLDSGLGKESFSIISQGQVEAIFNSKPEDRRAIFEEAAGVFKYKMHKQDAEKKLDDTQGNLDRVQDILYELESQIEPLRKQADIAESYLDQKEELTDLDIGLTVIKIKHLDEEIKDLKKDLKKYGEFLSEIDVELTENQQEMTQVKGLLSEINDKREQLQTDIIKRVQEIERTESSLTLHEEKTKHKEEFIHEKEQAITEQKFRIDALSDQLKVKNTKAAEQKSIVDRKNSEIKEKKEQLGYLEEGREERIEELRSIYVDYMQTQASLNNEEQSLNKDISKQSIQEEKNKKQKDDLETELKEGKTSLENKNSELIQVQETIDSLLNEFKSVNEENQKFNESWQTKQKRLQELRNQLEQAKAKENSLTEMQENYAGYFAGVKAIMKNKEQLEGIVGTVADLIQIPKEYLEAVDTVLASASQFIVVKDEKSGRNAINFLKNKRAGRATFLPLTTIKPRNIQREWIQNVKKENGFVGVASELIEYDSSVSNIIQNLLGNTLVASSLDSANKIARAVGFRHRVVSLDGNVMNAGGSMTGGGGKKSSNSHLFTQKEELKKLSIFIKETNKTTAYQEKELEEDREKNDTLTEKLKQIREEGEQKRYFENQLQNELKSIEESVRYIERQLKALTFETKDNSKELSTNKLRLEEVKKEKEEIRKLLQETNEEIELLTDEKKDSESKKEGLSTEIEKIQMEVSDQREKYASIRSTITNLEEQLTQNKENLKQLYDDVKAYQKGETIGSKEELTDKLSQLKNSYDKQKSNDKELKEEQVKQNKTKNDLEEKINELQERQQYYSDEKNSIEVKISRADVNQDHQLNYLTDEYDRSFEEARLMPELEMDFEEAEKKVKLLKKGIDELGPVNLNSIEEYKHISERYEFLSKQQNDLIKAKTQLFNTMDEMDNEVKKRFKQKFDEIKRQFSIVFPQMFGGGKGELYLTDPEDLLTSGVEIAAQPPGKKLTTLSLLSGGERALTAISLLFSIVQVSNVPFCILDEAEAALDESNVERFGKYLRNFDTDTQFIVITHRKGTMEQADSLYGITMQEKGISKLVSVQLEEVDEMDLAEGY